MGAAGQTITVPFDQRVFTQVSWVPHEREKGIATSTTLLAHPCLGVRWLQARCLAYSLSPFFSQHLVAITGRNGG